MGNESGVGGGMLLACIVIESDVNCKYTGYKLKESKCHDASTASNDGDGE